MSRYIFKLPDLGEGTVQAEIVAWRVKPGDTVSEDDPVVELMTEKASVEVPAPVSGRVVSVAGKPGEMVPVGAELIVFETDADAALPVDHAPAPATTSGKVSVTTVKPVEAVVAAPQTSSGGRVMTSPAIRGRAREAGVDLTQVPGSGPRGRIMRSDLDAVLADKAVGGAGRTAMAGASKQPMAQTEEIKVIGLRRVIAQRMSESKRNIPHFTYVEEVDVTELESLRQHLNDKVAGNGPQLTYLPFLVLALVRVLQDFPQCNALYDAERNVIVRHRAVHVGVATQTPEGLKVPVLRNAEAYALWDLSDEIQRLSQAARDNKAKRAELSGSTVTVTSLGKLGGIVSTPVINAPEVAIVGVNRAVDRPVVWGGAITIRRMMNLSSSFDHRFVDGHDAAAMIQALKALLEHPATIFLQD